ncbi:MAG: UPF0149 family protein [Casimicrobiaceae bacterium]
MPAELPSTPLSDAEITELDELLMAADEDRDPLDVVMLDGFLTGVLLQPDVVLPSAWLPLVFDSQGRAPALSGDLTTAQRTLDLIMRRHNEIAAHIMAREPFDPIVLEMDDADGKCLDGTDAIAALAPWTVGLMNALTSFPAVLERLGATEEGADALLGLLRHLPPDPEDTSDAQAHFEREKQALERDVPLANLDDAIDELAACVLEVADITRQRRPAMRDAPKIGRNDPCPCGSGRKFKQCHGRSVH